MSKLAWLIPPAAVLASTVATVVVLLYYLQKYRHGFSGGYLPLVLFAACIGVLAGVASHAAHATNQRRALLSCVTGVLAALASAFLLVVTLVMAFGS